LSAWSIAARPIKANQRPKPTNDAKTHTKEHQPDDQKETGGEENWNVRKDKQGRSLWFPQAQVVLNRPSAFLAPGIAE